MENLNFKSARFWPLFSNIFFPAELTLDNEFAYYRKKRLFFKPSQVSVNIKEIAFFDTSGIFNKTLEFGYTDQILMKGISSKNCNIIKKHIIANGAKIGKEGFVVKSLPFTGLSDLLKPLKWFLRERLILTDDAVLFIKRKLFSNKTTYLPFGKISFGYIDGWLSKKIYIIGEQNIMPSYSFPSKPISTLKAKLKEIGLELKKGKSFRPFWFSSGRNLVNPPRIFCTEKEIAYIDVLPFKGTVIKVLRYNEIETFKKRKWYSLLGSIVISGNVENIRGQSTIEYSREIKKEMESEKPVIKDDEFKNNIVILLKNVWFYRWRVFFISTGIRAYIKNHKNQ